MLATASERFNRQVNADWVSEKLDVQGWNVLEMLLPYHQMKHEIDHHRVRVLMKFTNQKEPEEIMLDIPADTWDELFTEEQFIEMVKDKQKEIKQERENNNDERA